MSHVQPKQYFAATQRAVANADAIEWEELPSLAGSLSKRLVNRSPGQPRGANDSEFMSAASGKAFSPWDNTMPATFEPAPVSQPFREPLEGLSTREVIEPDVFRHFFGANASD
jgi:hypothetical protein